MHREVLKLILDEFRSEMSDTESGAARLKQVGVLLTIYAFECEKDFSPTSAEIAEFFGVSASDMAKIVRVLSFKGLIKRTNEIRDDGRPVLRLSVVKNGATLSIIEQIENSTKN